MRGRAFWQSGGYLLPSHVNDLTEGRLKLRVLDHFLLDNVQGLHKLLEHLVGVSIKNLCLLFIPVKLMLLGNLWCFSDALATGPSRPCSIYNFLVIIEPNHDASDVIESFLCDTSVQDGIYGGTAPRMHRLRRFQILGLETSLPDLVHDLLVAHFLKDSIASDNHEVIVIFNLE